MPDYFLAINGDKQGDVLNPVLFCSYIVGLLVALSKAGVDCVIGNYFVGALVYADDIVLLAPSTSVLRIMLAIRDKIANDYCISFNASKSKCPVVLSLICRFFNDYINNCTFYIGNNPIEYVDSFEYLGYVITNQLIDIADMFKRRSDFVGQFNNVLCFFSKLSSLLKYRQFHSYCMSLYGSKLWLLVMTRSTTCVFHGEKACLPVNSHCY